MTPLNVDGAHPHRAASTKSGSKPQAAAASPERARELAMQFNAMIQKSMMDSLSALSADGSEDGGEEGAQDSGLGDLDLTGNGALAGLGASTSAGGGAEAQLAQALLAAYGVAPAAAASAVGATAPAASVSASRDARANARVVAEVAREQGVDPTVAVAMMLVESGGDAGAVGDNGTSFGLFQLHEGGMLTAAGLTPAQAYDPRTNATVSLRSLAHEWKKGPGRSPGEIAAASQRPADPAGYAAKVNAAMDRARSLLA